MDSRTDRTKNGTSNIYSGARRQPKDETAPRSDFQQRKQRQRWWREPCKRTERGMEQETNHLRNGHTAYLWHEERCSSSTRASKWSGDLSIPSKRETKTRLLRTTLTYWVKDFNESKCNLLKVSSEPLRACWEGITISRYHKCSRSTAR